MLLPVIVDSLHLHELAFERLSVPLLLTGLSLELAESLIDRGHAFTDFSREIQFLRQLLELGDARVHLRVILGLESRRGLDRILEKSFERLNSPQDVSFIHFQIFRVPCILDRAHLQIFQLFFGYNLLAFPNLREQFLLIRFKFLLVGVHFYSKLSDNGLNLGCVLP